MSMNLCFDVVGGAGMVEFPWQTSTNLTYEILAMPSKEEQLKALKKYIQKEMYLYEEGSERERWQEQTYAEVEALMTSPNLKLSLI